ncbi:MAG TPA: FtsX-like permease family protein [Tepidisphaeraceae bacterium]|nr:FtsX-like permease family protein [Tepidisphaeraceae bacterium]
MALSNFAARKSRVALTVAAVALSVSLVISVTSGYSSLFEAAFSFLNRFMGSTDARITRTNDPIGVPAQLVDQLRKDPDVRRADGRLDVPTYIPDPDDKEAPTKHVHLVGIDRPSDRRVDRLPLEHGRWFDTADEPVAVIDQAVAAILKVGVGDQITLPYADRKFAVRVVGIAHKPAVLAVHLRTIYLPLHTLQKLVGAEGRLSSVMIDFKSETDPTAFAARWRAKLEAMPQSPQIHLTSDIRSQMDSNLQGVQMLSYLGSAVSMLAATFIIFSALSMGVSERQRSLAMLRAIGAYRHQIGALVVYEGMLLALAGLVVGIPLGWIWIKALTLIFSQTFTAGAVLSKSGVILGTAGTLITALAASLLPAWTATRVSPLEAMSPLSSAPSARAPIMWALIGLAMAGIDPFLFYGPMDAIARFLGAANPAQAVRAWKFDIHFGLSLPALFFGFFLMAPMCVWIVERVAGPIVAAIFGLRLALVRQQLSTGLWRAAGTCAALMVGLAVLVVMQVSGHTLLGGWRLPDKFPDVFIGTSGLTNAQIEKLSKTPGIHEIMPIEIASTALGGSGGSPFAIAGSMLVPSSTMWIGIDPNKAFQMMGLDFRAGNRKDAERRLKEGGWVIVTEEYRQLTGAKVGDAIKLGGVPFRIAAVIWSPGIDVMVGMYDMGDQFEQRTVSSVFGSIADGEKYFGARPYLFAADLQPGLERDELIKRLKKDFNEMGLAVGDVREIKFKIQHGFFHLLRLMSTVAFAAMAVASLGVTNTIMAGVRSRRWQFGILRAVGATRGQLLRLVLAEALLLGLIGCILGLGAGFELSADANALAAVMTGYKPPLYIPWTSIGIGILAVLFISLLASIWPAAEVARTEPLTLLQAGRAST